jgi:protease-4
MARMGAFLNRHPFTKSLIKVAAYIWVGYHACIIAALGPLIFFAILSFAFAGDTADTATVNREVVYGDGFQELLSLKITGPIFGESDESPFAFAGETYGYDIKQQLMEAASDDYIKGIILEINSPGGTIYGANAIADGVKYYKEKTKKPVYAYIQGMGASGAYWAAAATDKIYADYGSDIGSIGVIMGPFKYYDKPVSEAGGLFDGGVVTQNGIENVVLSAGKSKDLGSPYRRMTADEIASLQKQINNEYDNFVKYVSARRAIPEATLRTQIGGMSYDNKTAKDLRLIDETASRETSYEALADAAGIKDDFQVTRTYVKGGFWQTLLSAFSGKPAKQAAATPSSPCLYSATHLAYAGNVAELCSR